MSQQFSTTWNASKQPRKQRKYRYNAPLHTKQKFLQVHLSPELRKKYSLRNILVKKGDKIKVLRGQFKKQEGKVEKVSLKYERVFVTGLEKIKKDGTKIPVAFNPSNLMILELNLDDKKRKQKVETKMDKPKSKQPTEEKK
ncbi:50S ribosomal protein L24 [Candidatus Woesearchaeota archaeon]|jgi:large subunit ribosomal protein L24|nr:50S ribosomal protein L24 [Candidatus Woesearchaeota archaeon]